MSPRKTDAPKTVVVSVRLSRDEWKALQPKRHKKEGRSAFVRRLLTGHKGAG